MQGRLGADAAGDPFADQRGLAIAGWGGEDGDFAAQAQSLVEALDEARAGYVIGARRQDEELGAQEGGVRGSHRRSSSGPRAGGGR